MHALHRSLLKTTTEGEPLPDVWRSVAGAGIRFYRGEYSLIAGPPGGLKSVFALQYAISSGVPALYISADMTEALLLQRALSLVTGMTLDTVKFLLQDPEKRAEHLVVLAEKVPNLMVSQQSWPTPERVAELALAHEELAGEPAHLVVVDNVKNVAGDGDSEWAQTKHVSSVLHWLAMEHGSAVVGLHHVKLNSTKATITPSSMADVKGQISDLPAMILTTAKDGPRFRLAAVKNRQGPADPTGSTFLELDFDGPRGRLSDPAPKPAWTPAYGGGSWYEREDDL